MFKKTRSFIRDCIINLDYTNALSVAASICNNETFKDIKNIFHGRKVALCGAGPSLQNYKPIDDCIHVALNRALLNEKVSFDWFIADDWDGINFFQEELIAFDGKKFFGHQIGSYDRQIPESFRIKCGAYRYYTDTYIVGSGYKSKMVCDIDKMAIGNMPNIAMSAMQIVLFTNPSQLYIVGCDASQGHFVQPKTVNDDWVNRHKSDNIKSVSKDNTIKKWMEVKSFSETFYPDTEIISVNPVGLKGIFKDIYQ